MPDTHDYGPFYWHLQHYRKPYGFLAWVRWARRRSPRPPLRVKQHRRPAPPIVEVATTHMVEEPYRVGHGLSLRFWPLRYAIVVGVWGAKASGELGELQLLQRAISSQRMVPVTAMGDAAAWQQDASTWRRPVRWRSRIGKAVKRVRTREDTAA